MQPRVLSATDEHVECELHTDHPLRLSASKGRRLECLAGILWITVHGQAEDVFLHAGETYVVPNGRLVLVEGIGRSQLRVAAPRSLAAACGALAARGIRKWRRYTQPRPDAV